MNRWTFQVVHGAIFRVLAFFPFPPLSTLEDLPDLSSESTEGLYEPWERQIRYLTLKIVCVGISFLCTVYIPSVGMVAHLQLLGI